MPRATWPPYRTVRGLVHRHVGRPAVIMGGGESLPAAIAHCPAQAVYISVNDHGVRLLKDRPALGRQCAYVVACDKIEDRARGDVGRDPTDRAKRRADGQPWGMPVISRYMWADYRLLFMPAPSSGMAAAWLARLLGCSPIILTGMDLYAAGTYYDDKQAKSSGRTITEKQHFARWCTMIQTYPAQYRVIGCSPLLQKRVGLYSSTEPADAPIDDQKLLNELRSVWLKVTRDVLIGQRSFPPGEILELSKAEVDHVMREKKGVRLKSGEAVS